jgi:hypothetical protein
MTTILTAVLTGVLVLVAGNLPWAGFGGITGLSALNFGFGTFAPWAMLPRHSICGRTGLLGKHRKFRDAPTPIPEGRRTESS